VRGGVGPGLEVVARLDLLASILGKASDNIKISCASPLFRFQNHPRQFDVRRECALLHNVRTRLCVRRGVGTGVSECGTVGV